VLDEEFQQVGIHAQCVRIGTSRVHDEYLGFCALGIFVKSTRFLQIGVVADALWNGFVRIQPFASRLSQPRVQSFSQRIRAIRLESVGVRFDKTWVLHVGLGFLDLLFLAEFTFLFPDGIHDEYLRNFPIRIGGFCSRLSSSG
jgi:hypothetical protein